MGTVVLLDPAADAAVQTAWAAWFADARGERLTLLLPRSGSEDVVAHRFEESVVAAARSSLSDELSAASGPAHAPSTVQVDLQSAERLRQAVIAAEPDLFVVLRGALDAQDELAARLGEQMLSQLSCPVVVVQLADAAPAAWPPQRLAVAAGRGPHARAAIAMAATLTQAAGGSLVAIHVEPDIGRDADEVGHRLLDRVLRRAIDGAKVDVEPVVEIDDDVEAGLLAAITRTAPAAVVFGVRGPAPLSRRFHGTLAARLARRTGLPVLFARDALPLGSRVSRAIEAQLARFVPQVERDVRVALSERVQSSSAWNFDFVALLSLATAIAALGLLQDSAAVIIGAMLIAPLMTPILGVGLALAQGNRRLATMAGKAIAFGVATAFVLALGIGLVVGPGAAAAAPTAQMLARGWPGVGDLMVAFAGGLAAAYALSRPGLVAALPGVAIAAALVPPIATSGLAVAAGNLELASGALLLFFTNMVAIVLAAGASLWGVGVRAQRDHGWLRHLGPALVVAVLALSVHLTRREHVGRELRLPARTMERLHAALPAGLECAALVAEQRHGFVVVHATVAGAAPPPPDLVEALNGLLTPLLGQPLRIDLDFVWRTSAGVGSPGR